MKNTAADFAAHSRERAPVAAPPRSAEWDRDSLREPGALERPLPDEVLEELRSRRHWLRAGREEDPSALRAALPRTADAIDRVRVEELEEGCGFCVLDGLHAAGLAADELIGVHWAIAELLGDPIAANIAGERLVEVTDLGGSLAGGARYHHTHDGGSHHTDSPQRPEIPDYVGLLCLRSALHGGESRVLSVSSVVAELHRRDPALLDVLALPFHFDKRGEVPLDEPPTTLAPILTWGGGRPELRYLRDYVDAGHAAAGEPLDAARLRALDTLDEVLADPRLALEFRMRPGQIQVLHNRHVLHGRRSFRDGSDPGARRLLIRVWIRARDEESDREPEKLRSDRIRARSRV